MNKIKVLFNITLLGFIFSCTADRIEDQTSFETKSYTEKRSSIPKVYATGYERIWSSDNPYQKQRASVWVDGVATALTDGTQTATGLSVAVDVADNVYVAGYERNGSKVIAKLWTNGVVRNLTNGTNSGSANSVFVDNNSNIYVGGYDGVVGKIWKIGGDTQTLTPVDASNVVRIQSIFKYNSDVYACGYEMSVSGRNLTSRVWKNGTLILSLGGVVGGGNTILNSIFVKSGDVYLAGREGKKSVVWKNGVPTYLSNGAYSASATSIYVVGVDVYASGYEYTGSGRLAKLWKNGVATNLTTDINGNALANSVHIRNSIVFVGGTVRNPRYSNVPNVATMWKNNVATSWSTQGYMHGIYSIYAK